ncbi:MAG: Mth938-like domain-containing protein [Alphaproteobacteria bacterium]
MDVTPLVRKGQHIIQSYAGGVFKVSGESYEHAIILSSDHIEPWDVGEITDVSDLNIGHFKVLAENSDDIDVVLLGCGRNMAILPVALRRELKSAGLSVDSMDTGAACRTYNVLMAEGRRVSVALLPG